MNDIKSHNPGYSQSKQFGRQRSIKVLLQQAGKYEKLV